MDTLYAYSLIPVLAVSLLLLGTTLLSGRRSGGFGMAMLCGSMAFWATSLLMVYSQILAPLGQRLAACGTFVVASYLHAAYDQMELPRDILLVGAYLVALLITAAGAALPGLLYDPVSLRPGPIFWPGMALAVFGGTIPIVRLLMAARDHDHPERKRLLLFLALAGAMCYLGSWSNALMLAFGRPLPFGLFLILGSMLLLAQVIRANQPAMARRLLDRSMLVSGLAALVSAGYLFGVLQLAETMADDLISTWRFGALFLLAMAALAFEPLRRFIQEAIGRQIAPHRAASTQLAEALEEQERKHDHDRRLAELGSFTSAIAHEVRNPLGVLTANLRMLEMTGADEELTQEMREQIERASHFIDDLLSYGRPRALSVRTLELEATLQLAWSTALRGLGELAPKTPDPTFDVQPLQASIEADQAQISQALVILIENALLALRQTDEPRLLLRARLEDDLAILTIEDSGPGLPSELEARIFEPFVTGRGRDQSRKGTGLGLAIARGVIERHHGTIIAGASKELGGASFTITLPRKQTVLAAATSG